MGELSVLGPSMVLLYAAFCAYFDVLFNGLLKNGLKMSDTICNQ